MTRYANGTRLVAWNATVWLVDDDVPIEEVQIDDNTDGTSAEASALSKADARVAAVDESKRWDALVVVSDLEIVKPRCQGSVA